MKKVYLILAISFCLLFAPTVKALKTGDSVDVEKEGHAITEGDDVQLHKMPYDIRKYLASGVYETYCVDPSLQAWNNYKVEFNFYDKYNSSKGDANDWYAKNTIIMMQRAIDSGLIDSSGTASSKHNYAAIQTALRLLRFRAIDLGEAAINTDYEYSVAYRNAFEYETAGEGVPSVRDLLDGTDSSNNDIIDNAQALINTGINALDAGNNNYMTADKVSSYPESFWEFRYQITATNTNFKDETTKTLEEKTLGKDTPLYDGGTYDIGFYKNTASYRNDGYYFEVKLLTNVSSCSNIEIRDLSDNAFSQCESVDISENQDGSRWGTQFTIHTAYDTPQLENVTFNLVYNDPREASNFFQLKPTSDGHQRMFMIYKQDIVKGFTFTSGSENRTCYKDDSGNYYGWNGSKLTAEGNTYGITNEEYIEQTFVNQCLCDITNHTNRSTFNVSIYDKLTSKAKNYYQRYCQTPDDGTPRTCEPYVSNRTCANGSSDDTFQIGDDLSCVFSTVNINAEVTASDATNKKYTYQKNEYCSQTCGETIDFSLPGEVGDVVAGTYWKWNDEKITLTGTRKCRSTVDTNKFETEMGSYNTGSENSVVGNRIKTIYQDGKVIENNDYISYPILQRLADIKKVYDEYNGHSNDSDASSSYGTDTNVTIGGTNGQARGPKTVCNGTYDLFGSCMGTETTYYCYKRTFTSSITGEVFERLQDTSENRCDDNLEYSEGLNKNGYSITNAKNTLKSLYDGLVELASTKVNNINACTDSLVTQANRAYDFDPTVKFSYLDKKYNTDFSGKEYKNISEERTAIYSNGNTSVSTEINDSNNTNWVSKDNFEKRETNSYPHTIDGGDNKGEKYYQHNANETTQTVKKTYRSNVYFFMTKANFSTGVLNSASAASSGDNYNFGYIYPISLNEEAENHKNWKLSFDKLGVDLQSGSSIRVGRFNKKIGNKSLDYTCYYNVLNDVTTPQKPNFFYRNISVNSFNPQDRTLGKNWTTEKGNATICEIEGGTYNQITGCTGSSVPEDMNVEYSFTLTPTNMQNIHNYNLEQETGAKKGYGDFNMTKVGTDILDKNGVTLNEGLWYTSDFIRKSNVCKDCFSIKHINEVSDTFSKWTKDVNKLSGNGPAWK